MGMVVFGAYPKFQGKNTAPNAEIEHVHIRLDQIVAVDPIHGCQGCQVHMSNGFVFRIGMEAEDFVRNFLTVLSKVAKSQESSLIIPPVTPQAA
jgi:endonuclease YncB( thermonuclease family)